VLPVVLSILLVVLMSGAVVWIVAGEHDQPTSADLTPPAARTPPPEPPPLPEPESAVLPLAPARRPATSRRRLPQVTVPAPLVQATPAPVAVVEEAPIRMSGAPMPRHRARSGFLMILLLVFIGVMVAFVIGIAVAALAFALRSAVTS
jgi:hypothetical protein